MRVTALLNDKKKHHDDKVKQHEAMTGVTPAKNTKCTYLTKDKEDAMNLIALSRVAERGGVQLGMTLKKSITRQKSRWGQSVELRTEIGERARMVSVGSRSTSPGAETFYTIGNELSPFRQVTQGRGRGILP